MADAAAAKQPNPIWIFLKGIYGITMLYFMLFTTFNQTLSNIANYGIGLAYRGHEFLGTLIVLLVLAFIASVFLSIYILVGFIVKNGKDLLS